MSTPASSRWEMNESGTLWLWPTFCYGSHGRWESMINMMTIWLWHGDFLVRYIQLPEGVIDLFGGDLSHKHGIRMVGYPSKGNLTNSKGSLWTYQPWPTAFLRAYEAAIVGRVVNPMITWCLCAIFGVVFCVYFQHSWNVGLPFGTRRWL